jgi:hypothetical protein
LKPKSGKSTGTVTFQGPEAAAADLKTAYLEAVAIVDAAPVE